MTFEFDFETKEIGGNVRQDMFPKLTWLHSDWPKIVSPEDDSQRISFRGFYLKEDEATDEIRAAFEKMGVKKVELRFKNGDQTPGYTFPAGEFIVLTRAIQKAGPTARDLYILMDGKSIERSGIACGWYVSFKDGKIVYKENGKPKLGGTFSHVPVLLRRVKGYDGLVTDLIDTPMALILKGENTDVFPEHLTSWREDFLKDRLRKSSTVWPAFVDAYKKQYAEYSELIGDPNVDKSAPFFATSIPLGFVSTKVVGTKDTSEINLLGHLPIPQNLNEEWVRARVITGKERAHVERLMSVVEAWAMEESIRKIYPEALRPGERESKSTDEPSHEASHEAPDTSGDW